jgi:hypothetical protein
MLRGRNRSPLAWLLPKHENRQPTKAIRYQADGGIKKVRTFNKDFGGGDDRFLKMPDSA